jgi:serine/threonine protein kinase/WD40 repeat protein
VKSNHECPPDPRQEKEIFEQAMTLALAEERERFVKQACRENPGLLTRVRELLQASAQEKGFAAKSTEAQGPKATRWVTTAAPGAGGEKGAAQAAEKPAGATEVLPMTEKAGDRLGRYKLLEKIGEGGCGVVYVAEQLEPVRRRVALKVVKLGMDTKQVMARFEAERQALAVMDHPNIAKVFDAGATDAGRPYFVMELVRGVRITQFCDERQLSLRERLDLFMQVCRAIQHAHQKGIIHRDIKPSNILVTLSDPGSPGVPKVIDFGIAKATAGRLTEQTLFTMFEQFLGTPAYMSPEQADVRGEDIDTRSDIYSLGAVLYELLTGRTPFESEALLKRGIEELIVTLREVEPPRPSTRLGTLAAADLKTVARLQHSEPAKLIPSLRGDLDWIVMKCLEKDRTRRYESANGLAMDVHRYLAGEAVVAAPPSTTYRIRKFVRRHRVSVIAASLVAAVLVLGVIGTTRGMIWALREKGRANDETAKATLAARLEAEARRQAEDNAKAARLAAENAERAAYRAQMVGAARAVEEQRMDAAGALLAATPPALRGWEYRHLLSRLDLSLPSPLPADWSLRYVANSTGAADIAVCRRTNNGAGDEWVVLDSDLRTERLALPGTDLPGGFALCPDGKRALWAPNSLHIAKLWNLETREVLATVPTELSADTPAAVTWSPSGERFLLQSPAGFEVRDGHTGDLQGRVEIPAWAYFTGDERWIIAHGTRECRLFDSRSLQQQPAVLKLESAAPPSKLAFWQSQVAIAMQDGTLRLVEIVDGVLHERLKLGGGASFLSAVAWSHDGRLVAVGTEHGRIRVWEAASGTPRGDFAGPESAVECLLFLRESGDLLAVYQNHHHCVWPINSGSPGVLTAHRSFVYPAVLSRDGSVLLTGGWDGAAGYAGGLKLWDARTGVLVAETGQPGEIFWSADLTPDGRCAVMGVFGEAESERRSEVIDLATGSVRTTFRPPTESQAERTIAHPDGRRVLSTYRDGEAYVWDLFSGKVLWETGLRVPEALRLIAHCGAAISPDGRWLSLADGELGIRLVDAGTYHDVRRWGAHTGAIWSLSFSPDGKWLLSSSEDHTVGVWEAATGKLVARLVGHGAEVLCAAVSPDGTRIASGGRDGYVRLWDTTHFENVAQLGGHTSYIYSLAWSPDGTQLVSSSGDGTVRLWDTRPLAEQVTAIRARDAALPDIQARLARALADARNPQEAFDALMKTGGWTPRERELAWQVAVGSAFRRAAAKGE